MGKMKRQDNKDEEFVEEGDADQLRDSDVEEIDGEDAAEDKIKKMRQELKKCMSERGEYLAGWQRAKADFVNRDRASKEEAARIATASRERLLEELLPVLDGFDMAISSPAWQNVETSWRQGMEVLHKQLTDVLEQNGIEMFDPKGKPFDPAEHEAVGTVAAESAADDHCVAQVLQKGYRLNGRMLRPARVTIAQFEP